MERYHRRNVCASLRMHRPTYKAGCARNGIRSVERVQEVQNALDGEQYPTQGGEALPQVGIVSSADQPPAATSGSRQGCRSVQRRQEVEIALDRDFCSVTPPRQAKESKIKDNLDESIQVAKRTGFRRAKRTERFRRARPRRKNFRLFATIASHGRRAPSGRRSG